MSFTYFNIIVSLDSWVLWGDNVHEFHSFIQSIFLSFCYLVDITHSTADYCQISCELHVTVPIFATGKV